MSRLHEYRSAGGIVIDSDGRVLPIERHVVREGTRIHEIRLPKGHIEPGETPREAAVREVVEESGYVDAAVTHDLGSAITEFSTSAGMFAAPSITS